MSLFDRFTAKYIPEPNSGCWLWLSTMSNGRAMIWEPGMTTAARVAWKLFRGPIPFGMDILHRCDNPLCVNPDHLFFGTAKDNVADMVAKNRYTKIKPRGEKHGNTKLTDRDFLEIFQLRGHMFVWEIAQAYGITPAYVSHIQLGRYKR